MDYYNALDRKEESFESVADIHEIGASTAPMDHQTQALKARIFHGASRIELGFMGVGKTNKQQPGPEAYGKKEREDMRDLAIINEVQTSTHASTGVKGLSGLHEGRFDGKTQKDSMDEVRKAIDFAAEASTGGAVVFHTGDVPRSMIRRWGKDGQEFRLFKNEEEEGTHYLVDDEKKTLIQAMKDNEYIFDPIQDKDPKTGELLFVKNLDGTNLIDPITEKPVPIFKYNKDSADIEVRKIKLHEYRDEYEREHKDELKGLSYEKKNERIVKEFYKKTQLAQISYQLGQSRLHAKNYVEGLDERKKIIDSLKFYTDLKKKTPEADWWKVKQQGYARAMFIPPDIEDPVEYLTEKLHDNERQIAYGREIGLSGVRAAKEAVDKVNNHIKLAEEFTHERSTKAIGELAAYAHEKYLHEIKKNEQEGRMDVVKQLKKNPIFVSPEAWLPEDYGSHPDEIKKIIVDSRKAMVNELTSNNKYSKDEAEKLAKQHIKATVDIGHMNTWRKYYVRKDGESIDDYNTRFDNWIIKNFKGLAKEGMIGHIHLSDNYGYHDEHLAVGEGNAPVKEFVKAMKEAGLNDFIVESGSFNPLRSMSEAWAHLSSPVHRLKKWEGGDSWMDFKHSYFGHNFSPSYIVGSYAPSNDFKGAPFYSGLGLEDAWQGGDQSGGGGYQQ